MAPVRGTTKEAFSRPNVSVLTRAAWRNIAAATGCRVQHLLASPFHPENLRCLLLWKDHLIERPDRVARRLGQFVLGLSKRLGTPLSGLQVIRN